MFEDVGDAGRIPGRRPKAYGEEILPVVAVEVQELRPGPFVFDLISGYPDFRDLLDPEDMETMSLIPGGKRRGRADVFYAHDLSFPVSALGTRNKEQRRNHN
jgi:hypothetical protein